MELLGIPEEDHPAIIAKMSQQNQHDAANTIVSVQSKYVLRSRIRGSFFNCLTDMMRYISMIGSLIQAEYCTGSHIFNIEIEPLCM